MYEKVIDSMLDYLSEQETALRKEAAAMAADFRVDEGNFLKIRANVFSIFKAVLETAVKIKGRNGAALDFFATKLRDIPSSWRSALSAADAADTALVEKLKLESVAEIESAFAQRMEATK